MTIGIDPVTRQRIVFDRRSGDMNYDLIGDSAISQETVSLIGPWIDFTGSDLSVDSKGQQQQAGLSNQLEGQDPAIEGERVGNLGVVGQNTETTRRRTIKRHVEINKDGNHRFS